jgi:exodeoxyribonuclease VII large subunit
MSQQLGLTLQEPRALTVTELNNKARSMLERNFESVRVEGEISNLKTVSGHTYFTLKDERSQLPAVLFRREASRLKFKLESGMEVTASGRLTVYPAYGRYQIVLDAVEPMGAGALHAAFEQLKARLQQEGLFDAQQKSPLPTVPSTIAVVTSPTGAVIRDICNVAYRRYPMAQILVIPTRVQGADSAVDIAGAIAKANEHIEEQNISTIIVARGGGSLEDLWGFNDERVARAVAASGVPVVSAVGHETDFTICDFVADHRAPTPSAAAELVFPIYSDLLALCTQPVVRSAKALRRSITGSRDRLRLLNRSLGDGQRIIREPAQRLVLQQERIQRAAGTIVSGGRQKLQQYEIRLRAQHPRVRLQHLRESMGVHKARIGTATAGRIQHERDLLVGAARRLDALSPLGVLDRGYSIVLGPKGKAIRKPSDVRTGDELDVRLRKGSVKAQVI